MNGRSMRDQDHRTLQPGTRGTNRRPRFCPVSAPAGRPSPRISPTVVGLIQTADGSQIGGKEPVQNSCRRSFGLDASRERTESMLSS